MKLITIHGIRRTNKWYETLAEFDEIEVNGVDVIHFEYGYLDLLRFLNARSRSKIIERFQKFYSDNISKDEPPPSVVCHSFGTYIFYSAIDKYKVIKFDKVIMCGSILNPDTNWARFFKSKQIVKVYHDFGRLDHVVTLSKFVLGSNAGNSGKVSFQKIPKKYSQLFIQEDNRQFTHSDYFLPLHMETTWLGFLLEDLTKVEYDRKILRSQVIERLYDANLEDTGHYSRIEFSARIDNEGNYYASYRKHGVCIDVQMNDIIVHTTADAIQQIDTMGFRALDTGGRFLSIRPVEDEIQKKTVRILFREPLNLGEHFSVTCRFKWQKTIALKGGDTDHFWVANCDSYSIKVNFPKPLISPSFIAIKDRKALKRLPLKMVEEKDGTVSYGTQSSEKFSHEGIVMYFEGVDTNSNSERLVKFKTKMFPSKNGTQYSIKPCHPNDIKDVYAIESKIESGNAAQESTLFERLNMFPNGFLIAKNEKGKVVGYLESVIWNDIAFDRFDEICDFPLHYDPSGDTLYIIYVAVEERSRGLYIGLELVRAAIDLALSLRVKRIKLVAKDNRIGLYQKCGFSYIKELPNFLSSKTTKNILMVREL